MIWLVAFNLLIAQIFAGPPYLLNTAELGYMSAGTVVGGVLTSVFCGTVSDPIIKFFARRNGGVYEPEYRLMLTPLALILTLAAYFPFGYMIKDGKSPVAISAMYGIATASAQVCMAVVGGYVVDAYPDINVEVLILTVIVKNFLFYGFSCKYLLMYAGSMTATMLTSPFCRLCKRLDCALGHGQVLFHCGCDSGSIVFDYDRYLRLW